MTKFIKTVATISCVILIAVFTFLLVAENNALIQVSDDTIEKFDRPENDRAVTNKGRREYFFQLLRNPKTNKIPSNVREKELNFASQLRQKARFTKTVANSFEWTEIGPNDVSGRTLGIGIDSRNKDIIIAGGASGGIWKSTDGGTSWALKSNPSHNLGVSSLTQHPTNKDTWFYSTGEYDGSLGNEPTIGAGPYFGSGLYTSTDNGETWNSVSGTTDFDFISKVVVSPTTGTLFFASNWNGVYRSTENGSNPSLVIGKTDNHIYADVGVSSDGTLYAALSGPLEGVTPTNEHGVYISEDDGLTWDNITPEDDYPDDPNRSVIGVSPSNGNIFYVFTDIDGTAGNLSLFRFEVTEEEILHSDLSSAIPDFGGEVGTMDPQGGYNMVCKVLPNDPDFVILGTTNLIRSTDGFSSSPQVDGNGIANANQVDKYWIGGYAKTNNLDEYQNHHADQHNLVFDPTNPKRAFSAHDGGISVTEDITASDVSWVTKEQGYNVTQFYTVSIHPEAGRKLIGGGTQDNGTPVFTYNLNGNHSPSDDVTSGDGSFFYLGSNYAIASNQNGNMTLNDYFNDSDLLELAAYIKPLGSTDQLFIHPFAVNPANEDYVAYPQGNLIWRNNQMVTLPENDSPDGTSVGWAKLSNVNIGTAGQIITSLEYTTSNPSNRLYFGGSALSDFDNTDLPPKIFRLDAVDGIDGEVDISISGADAGSYLHDLAVNPKNGDELIAVFSNYEVESIWYSSNAGTSWTSIEGSLGGVDGPSIRAAVFAPTDTGTRYFVGTSIGLFSTSSLNGSSTVWTQESGNTIAQSVIAALHYRQSDDVLAVATHGRGLFLGKVTAPVANEPTRKDEISGSFALKQNYPNPFNPSTSINFSIPSNSNVTLKIFDITGKEIASIFERKTMSRGNYTQTFDASSLASGTYLYRLEAVPVNGGQSFVESKTMTLIK